MTNKGTSDAIKIFHRRYIQGNAEAEAALAEARERLRVADRLRELREAAGLTQQEVADRVGTQRSVIARLESSGYDRHTISTLRRVAEALDCELSVEFIPVGATVAKERKAPRTARPKATRPKAAADRDPRG